MIRGILRALLLVGFLAGLAGGVIGSGASAGPAPLPEASARALPRWRGFNLLNRFHRDGRNEPFEEEDFRLIAALGFNFVRLPMDYRTWIVDDDPRRFNEEVLADVDRAVAWGERYGLHVCINFHRTPGYSVAPPPEPFCLWTDAEPLDMSAMHWAMFARRYRGIPNRRLSFHLINEPPPEVDGPTYARIVRRLLEAIRAEDPDRLVICDGLAYGTFPCPELIPLGVAQAGRGYAPFALTHYQAEWVDAAQDGPPPVWPDLRVNRYLYGPLKAAFQSPLRLRGRFDAPGQLRLQVQTVSGPVRLQVWADDRPVGEIWFRPGPGEGEWKRAVYRAEWDIYQNDYDRAYVFRLDQPARDIRIELVEGDWLTLSEIGWRVGEPPAPEYVLRIRSQVWGERQAEIRFDPDRPEQPFSTDTMYDRDWLKQQFVEPWRQLQARGVGVMIAEWGVYRRTPHATALRWMRDNLENWRDAGMGWALWEFRGPFGIFDSGRDDVEYEVFHGRQLDRRMLELLQAY